MRTSRLRTTGFSLLALAALLALPLGVLAQDAAGTAREKLERAIQEAPAEQQRDRWRDLARHLDAQGNWLDAAYAWNQAWSRGQALDDARAEARSLLQFAEKVLAAGEGGSATKASFADAEIALRRARKEGATDDWIGIGLARCAAALGRTDEQIEILQGAVRTHPSSDAARRALAFAYYHAGRDEAALAAFEERIAEGASRTLPLVLTAADAARRSGDDARAKKLAERAIHLAPHDSRGWLALWKIHAADKRFGELAERLDVLARAHEESAVGAHYAGFAASSAAEYDRALAWLDRARERNPRNIAPLLERARILRDVKRDHDASVAAYMEVLELDPANLKAAGALSYMAGQLSDRDGRPDKAVPLFRAIVKARPDDGTVYANLALALRWSGANEEARRAYEKAEELSPYDAQARNDHGLLLLVMGLDDAARARFQDAADVDDRHNDGRENLGFMDREIGDLEGAESWFLEGWKAARRRGEDGARHRRNLDDVRFPLPPLSR